MIDFEALGLTKEDLQERLIETLADRMLKSKGWDSDGDEISLPSSLRSQLEALITKRMDRAVQAAFDATVPSTEARVRQIAADLVSERERVAELEAQLGGELKHRIQARTSKPEWQSFLTLKYGEARAILALLQDGQISVGKACEALAELAHGVSPRIPEPQGEPLSDDVVPSKRIAELEAALAQQKQMYEQEAKWRKAYQEAKGKMYEEGGEIGQFAIDNMPCNEGELDLWFCKIYVSREAYDSLKAELEAALAEARRDGERYMPLRWRPLADLHEEDFPIIAMPVYDPGGFQMFETIDQWNETGEEDVATFDLYLPLACTARKGFCKTLDAAIAAAAAEGEKK